MVIDFEEFVISKFIKFVSAYLELPPVENERSLVVPCIEILLERCGLTEEKLKSILQKNHIPLHEKYFKTARKN